MFDRLTNLITLAIFVIAFGVGANSLYEAWRLAPPWEEEWVVISGKEPQHTSEQLLAAIKKATELGEFKDADALEAALRSDFRRTGKVLVHVNNSELLSASTSFATALLFLLLPLSVNYLRRGKFRLWNRGA